MNLIGENIISRPLKDLAYDMHQGINTVTEKVEYLQKGVPILQSKHITKGFLSLDDTKFLSNEAYLKYKDKYQPKIDDILVCNIGTIGKSIRVLKDNPFLIAWNLFLIKIKESDLHSAYFAHYLNYLADKKYYDRFLTGGTVKFINKKTMGNIPVPTPPLEQQKQIASILDTADAYRQKTKALIEKYDALTQSLFLDMFGDTNLFEHYPISEVAAKEKYSLSSGPFGSNLTSKHYTDGGVIILRGTNVTSGILDLSNIKYISEEKAIELRRSELKPGDVVIVAVGSSGKAFKIPSKLKRAIMSQNFNKITPDKKKATPMYLEFCFNSQLVQNQFKKEMTDTVRTFLSLTKIKKVTIPIPPLDLQLLFEERVQAIEVQKALAQQELDKADELFNSLLQKAFKGELV